MPYCGKCGIRLTGNELYCPSCGSAVPPAADSLLMRPCAGCGAMVDADEEVCPNCGRVLYSRVDTDQAEKKEERKAEKEQREDFGERKAGGFEGYSEERSGPYPSYRGEWYRDVTDQPVAGSDGYKSKYLALFFCFFFGVFGVHRFYEGKIASGILYLLTFGLFGVGWLVDLIILLTRPNPYRP